jgi:hypothetical protein
LGVVGGGGGADDVVVVLFVAGCFAVDDSAQLCVIRAVALARKTASAATEAPFDARRGPGDLGF